MGVQQVILWFCLLATSLTTPAFAQNLGWAPPNTVKVDSNLYIDRTEAANVHWLEFLYYARKDSSSTFYKSMWPDTSVTRTFGVQDYLLHKDYRYHPVVGISYTQAKAYCQWRSMVVSKIYNHSDSVRAILGLTTHDSLAVVYRLPTVDEWEAAAQANLSPKVYPYGLKTAFTPFPKEWNATFLFDKRLNKTLNKKEFTKAYKGLRKKKVIPTFISAVLVEDLFAYYYSSPVYIYGGTQNSWGLYNMPGNIAEMVETEGLAKGGSFIHSIEKSQTQGFLVYSGPEMWLGFRCVAEIKVYSTGK